jgi:hypothetical protein
MVSVTVRPVLHQNTNTNLCPQQLCPFILVKVGLGEPSDEGLDAQLRDRAVGLVVGRIREAKRTGYEPDHLYIYGLVVLSLPEMTNTRLTNHKATTITSTFARSERPLIRIVLWV